MCKSKLKFLTIYLFLTLIAVTIISCSDDTVTPQGDNLDFSVMSVSDSTDNIGILHLEEVKILLKDIKLNVSNSNQDSTNFRVGPYLLYLNLASNINIITSAYIPPGTYDKVRFMIHKLEDNEPVPDPDFSDAGGRYSVVVKGRYNGISFTYKSSKSAHQKLTFPNSLVISTSGKSNITLLAKPYIWFIKNGVYLDPAIEQNRNDIDNNIKDNINNNFKIFLDNDKNGIPD